MFQLCLLLLFLIYLNHHFTHFENFRSNRSVPVGGNIFVPVFARNNLPKIDIHVHSESSHYPIAYILGSLNQSTETNGISFNVSLYITCSKFENFTTLFK